MWNFFSSREILTDGVIDLRPFRGYLPQESLRFGEMHDYRITLHGKRFEIGQISVRLGESTGIYYFGHIGYHIDPPWRGHHYAARACLLVHDLFVRAGKESAVITTDPDNEASRRTCEKIGCVEERTVKVPLHLQKEWELSAEKVRYIWII